MQWLPATSAALVSFPTPTGQTNLVLATDPPNGIKAGEVIRAFPLETMTATAIGIETVFTNVILVIVIVIVTDAWIPAIEKRLDVIQK